MNDGGVWLRGGGRPPHPAGDMPACIYIAMPSLFNLKPLESKCAVSLLVGQRWKLEEGHNWWGVRPRGGGRPPHPGDMPAYTLPCHQTLECKSAESLRAMSLPEGPSPSRLKCVPWTNLKACWGVCHYGNSNDGCRYLCLVRTLPQKHWPWGANIDYMSAKVEAPVSDHVSKVNV